MWLSLGLALAQLVPSAPVQDWLTTKESAPASLAVTADGATAALANGLIVRRIDLARGGVTVALDDLRDGASLLRVPRGAGLVGGHLAEFSQAELQPVACVVLDGVRHELGLAGAGLTLASVERGTPLERLTWQRARRASPLAEWPPRGTRLSLTYAPVPGRTDVPSGARVVVHHELYTGVPLCGKFVEVQNVGSAPFTVDHIVSERLACVESDSWVETRGGVSVPSPARIEALSEYAMGGMEPENAHRFGVRWSADPDHPTQVNYLRSTPCLLEIAPEDQFAVQVEPGGRCAAPAAFVVVHDREDRTRRALTMARVYEVLAPWVTENPLMMHVRHSDDAAVRLALRQAAEVGFEVVILTFGSGFDMENTSPESLARWKGLADEAAALGVELGGYSLLSSRRVEPATDMCVDPETGRRDVQTHGCCPALTSQWGRGYLARQRQFFDATGFDLLEQDGPYPGDRDATERPPYQVGAADSRFKMWRLAADLFRDLRARGVYVNQPDWYFLVGGNKTGMGYRETNWSLPRAQQVLHARQNIFDGARHKRPSMGWMFVPLTEYHGGGAAATVEPLDEHRRHYAAMLAANLGAGVQACYRGPRLYDTDATRDMVRGWVTWYRAHRDILEAPIVLSASRRADGRDVDWLLHADPRLPQHQGMLVVYRPDAEEDAEPLVRDLWVDLTYTGLASEDSVTVDMQGVAPLRVVPDRRGGVTLTLTIPAGEPLTWAAFRK